MAGAILHHETEPAGSADPGDGRRREGKSASFRQLVNAGIYRVHDRLKARLTILPMIPRLQSNENEGAISGVRLSEETVPDHRAVILDALRVLENRFHFAKASVLCSEAASGSCMFK